MFHSIYRSSPKRLDKLPFLSPLCVEKYFDDEPERLSSESEQVELQFLDQISIFSYEKHPVFRFPKCGIFIANPSFFECSLISFHMTDLQVTQDYNRISGAMDPVGELQVLTDEIQAFIEEDFFEDMCGSEKRISGIHLDIVPFFLS